MGENGAGKSTLLKILGGAYIPNSGTVGIGEQTMAFKCAADSIASGIAVIHQELHLVPEMTVAENLFLGHLPARFGVVNHRLLRQQALACLKGLADEIDPEEKLGRLSLFFFKDTATTEIYTLSLHDALPISAAIAEPADSSHHQWSWRIHPHLANPDRKSTRLNSSHTVTSYAVFCLKKK